MNLKVAGMSWVRNICQKFEAVCREVDDIVNHDSIKYIEKQVLIVGENIMKFYSKLVQDLVTPIVDSVSNEADAVNQQVNAAISSYFKSILGIGEDFADTADVQSTVQNVAFESLKNQLVHASGDLQRINEQGLSVFDGSLEETESKLVGAENDMNKSSGSSGKENAIMESVAGGIELDSPDKKAQFEACSFCELANYNHEKEFGASDGVKVEASVDYAMSEFLHTEGTVFVTSTSDTLGFLTESASSSYEVNTEYISCASSASSAFSAIPADVASSGICCKKTIAEMGSKVSSNTLPNEACTIHTDAPKISSTTIVLHNDAIGTIEWQTDYFSSQIDSHGNKVVEREPVSCSSSIAPLMESLGSSNNCSCETADFNEGETNLSCQVELEESCVIIDCSALHDVSCEAPKLRSYKQKIWDALSSKKRLAREYEQLAILHGDNATKFCQGSLPAPPTLLLGNSETLQLSDSEWEIL